jgi:acyl dehydratase
MKYPAILSVDPGWQAFAYDEDFAIRYALSVGAGEAADDLRFVYEKGLQALPTLAVLMPHGAGEIIAQGELDLSMIVHGEHRLAIHQPLPPAGRMAIRTRCLSVADKGCEKGALVNVESVIAETPGGDPYATSIMTWFCRGDGGFGGPTDGKASLAPVPERPHDRKVVLPTIPHQAAWYRLNGDKNPLHIDPDAAQAAGFPRPILHGLCTYAIACRAVLKACCDNDPARIEQFDARLSAPLFPGETIATRIWRDGRHVAFECIAVERGESVIRNGSCLLRK